MNGKHSAETSLAWARGTRRHNNDVSGHRVSCTRHVFSRRASRCSAVSVSTLSPFLIGRMFLREPSWKYSANLFGFLIGRTFLREPSWKYSSKLYSGSKKHRSTCSGNIRPIRRSLPLIGWEQSSPVYEEKIKIKMDDGVASFFTRFGGNLFICWLVGGAPYLGDPEWDSS